MSVKNTLHPVHSTNPNRCQSRRNGVINSRESLTEPQPISTLHAFKTDDGRYRNRKHSLKHQNPSTSTLTTKPPPVHPHHNPGQALPPPPLPPHLQHLHLQKKHLNPRPRNNPLVHHRPPHQPPPMPPLPRRLLPSPLINNPMHRPNNLLPRDHGLQPLPRRHHAVHASPHGVGTETPHAAEDGAVGRIYAGRDVSYRLTSLSLFETLDRVS